MQLFITIDPKKYEGRTPQWVAKELFVILENEGVDVLDVKHLSDVRPKIEAVRYEHGKPVISITLG